MTGANGIGEVIDRKFQIAATCREHDHDYDGHHAVLFLAKDRAFPATLRFYRQECERIGAAPAQLAGIDLLIERRTPACSKCRTWTRSWAPTSWRRTYRARYVPSRAS